MSYAGKAGSITISDAGGGRLKGTFTFTAVAMTGSSATVAVTGTFDAVTGAVTIP